MAPDHCHALAFSAHQRPSRSVCATVICPRLCSFAPQARVTLTEQLSGSSCPRREQLSQLLNVSACYLYQMSFQTPAIYSFKSTRTSQRVSRSSDRLILHCRGSADVEARRSAKDQTSSCSLYLCNTKVPTHNLTVQCPLPFSNPWLDSYPLPVGPARSGVPCSAVSAPPPTGSCECACISARPVSARPTRNAPGPS